MKTILGSLALLIGLAACSTYDSYDSAGAGSTSSGHYGDIYDYQGEAGTHVSD